jgi:PLP dependent protein
MDINARLETIYSSMNCAKSQFANASAKVEILAVSKGQTTSSILAAFRAGLTHFGENYLQEALPKIQELRTYPFTWHFIGRLQANKTLAVAENFAWVHSITSSRIATRLAQQRSAHLPALNCCLQVNLDNDSQKAGIPISELFALARFCQALPQLKLRGLMTIIGVQHSDAQRHLLFAKLRQALLELNTRGFALDTLSMGMSQDYVAAIAEGATIIRLGSCLFGERTT